MSSSSKFRDIAICLGYFCVGVCYMAIYQKISMEELKSGFELLSFIATIGAAVVATFTLTAWRSQWEHGESYSALKKLSLALADLTVVYRYIRSYADYISATISDVEKVSQFEALYKANQVAYSAATKEYRSALEDVRLLLGDVCAEGILESEDCLSEKVRTVIQSIILLSYSSNPEDPDARAYALERALDLREEIDKAKTSILRVRQESVR
jgi:hypothetical protein